MGLLKPPIFKKISDIEASLGEKANKINGWVNVADFGAKGDGVTDDTSAIQTAMNTVSSGGGGTLYFEEGTYKCNRLELKAKVNMRGSGMMSTTFDFSLSSDYGFLVTGGVSNFLHGGGLYDLKIMNAPSHGFYVDNTSGGGIGEGYYIDRVQSNVNGGDGFRFHGDSTPLHLGHISTHGNGGSGIHFISEVEAHVQVLYIAGDNNAESLVTIENIGTNANYHIIGWKSERWSASPGHPNIFVIKNATGGYVHIGAGRYSSQVETAPNAIVRVESGSAIMLHVDPISTGTGVVADYTYGVENLINSTTRTPSQMIRQIYTTVPIKSDSPYSAGETYFWSNFINSIGANKTNNVIRFNHPNDGANGYPNIEFYDGSTTKVASMTRYGGLNLADVLRIGNVSSGPVFMAKTGSPEGVYTAVVGSVYLRTDGGTGTTLYFKESGTSNIGWVAINGNKSGTTANRPSGTGTGYQYFDTTINKPIWYTGSAWVDATGTTV